MDNTPFISVVVPCYNGEKWIDQAVQSVLKQTLKSLEVILIDDGSRDGTLSRLRQWAALDSRVRVIAKSNTGLADTLNQGIASCRARWIARLDADDLAHPQRLERQWQYLAGHPDTVLLGTGFVETDGEGLPLRTHTYPSQHGSLVARLERSKGFFPHSSAVFNRDAFERVGGYLPRILRAEDRMLWLELSRVGKIGCLAGPLVSIRKHTGQVSHDQGGRRQFVDATAATVCYFLMREGRENLARSLPDSDWDRFYAWIDQHSEISRGFARRKIWGEARREYFQAGGGLAGWIKFLQGVMRDGQGLSLFREKLWGSLLGERLARAWAQNYPSL